MSVIHSLAISRGKFHKLDVDDKFASNPEEVIILRVQNDFEAMAAYLDIVQHHVNEYNKQSENEGVELQDASNCHAGIQKTLDMARHYISADL